MRNRERYADNWSDVIRPAILARDNYKCTSCNAKHRTIGYRDSSGNWIECDEFMIEWCKGKGIKTKKLFLQVAHLDHNPNNNDPLNLSTKCPRCHFINDKALSAVIRKSK